VPADELLHTGGQTTLRIPEDEMEMIRHQAVREASPAESSHGAIQPHQERVAVAVIAKMSCPQLPLAATW